MPNVGRMLFSVARGHNYFNTYGFYSLTFRRNETMAIEDRGDVVRRTRDFLSGPQFGNCVDSIKKPATGFELPSYRGRGGLKLYGGEEYLTPAPYPGVRISRARCLSVLQGLEGLGKVGGIFVHDKVHFSCLVRSRGSRFFHRLMGCRVDNRLEITPRRYSTTILSGVNGPRVRDCGHFYGVFCSFANGRGGSRCIIPCLVDSRPKSALSSTMRLTLFYGHRGVRPGRIRSFCPAPNAVSADVFCARLSPCALGRICIPGSRGRGTVRETLLRCFVPRGGPLMVGTLVGTNEQSLVNGSGGYLMAPVTKRARNNCSGRGGGHGSRGRGKENGGNGSGFTGCEQGGGGGWSLFRARGVNVHAFRYLYATYFVQGASQGSQLRQCLCVFLSFDQCKIQFFYFICRYQFN